MALHLICFLPTNPKNTPLCRKQWEEEDFPYPTPFLALSSANILSPKKEKQPKTNPLKMLIGNGRRSRLVFPSLSIPSRPF